MCGIVGWFSERHDVQEEPLVSAVTLLDHRGPDSRNIWISRDRKVGLGHARLSIIGLSNGVQPISNEDQSIHIIVNGEFYEFESIREALLKKGHRFRTESDSEILVHLYEEHGISCLDFLRGEFAFVLWDDKKKLLFAARDRFGIKPLHYCLDGRSIKLASEAKSLFALGMRAEWDLESVNQVARARSPLPDRTVFKDVLQIPAGHFLTLSNGDVNVRKYWDVNYSTDVEETRSEKDLIEEFKYRFEEAVKLRLRSDVPVAVNLSGGLDSSAVLGAMSQFHSGVLHAFTVRFTDKEFDESDIARETAKMFGVTQHFVDVSSHDIAGGFSKMIWHTETICQNPHGVGKLMLSKTVRDAGIKVVLTGEGSDEMLGGYDQMQRDFVLDPSVPEAAKPSRPDFYRQQMLLPKHNQASATLDDLRSPTFESAIGFFPSFYAKHVGKAKIFHSLVNADFLKAFGHRDEYAILLAQLDVKGQLVGRDRLHQSMYLWTKTSLQNYILAVLADRVEMGNSVESRVPFLDHRFVEFVATLPSTILNRQGTEKYILREATKPYISKTIYNRHKWAFLAPPAMPGGAYFDFIQDSLRGSQIPFVNQVSLRNLLDQLPKMSDSERAEYSILLTELLSMHHLQENFMSRAAHARSRSAEERSLSASTPG